MKSLLARYVLVLVCLIPQWANGAIWYFTVLLKSDRDPDTPMVHYQFQHQLNSDQDLFKLMEKLTARPLDFHSPEDFSYYVGTVVPTIGFDPISDSIGGMLLGFNQGLDRARLALNSLAPHRLLPYLIQAGTSIEHQFIALTGMSLASWPSHEFISNRPVNFGDQEITWPLPVVNTPSFS